MVPCVQIGWRHAAGRNGNAFGCGKCPSSQTQYIMIYRYSPIRASLPCPSFSGPATPPTGVIKCRGGVFWFLPSCYCPGDKPVRRKHAMLHFRFPSILTNVVHFYRPAASSSTVDLVQFTRTKTQNDPLFRSACFL